MLDASRIVTKPMIYLTSQMVANRGEMRRYLDDQEYEGRRLHWDAQDSALLVEWASRLCYQSWDMGRADLGDFLDNLLASAHGSVLRHAAFGLTVTGISRSLSMDLMRHETGFERDLERSELSQRYVDLTTGRVRFVLPPRYLGNAALTEAWSEAVEAAWLAYHRQVTLELAATSQRTVRSVHREERKRILEAARALLPNSTETQGVFTVNLQALRYILRMRLDAGADLEINRLAFCMLQLVLPHALDLLQDLRVSQLPDGAGQISTAYAI